MSNIIGGEFVDNSLAAVMRVSVVIESIWLLITLLGGTYDERST